MHRNIICGWLAARRETNPIKMVFSPIRRISPIGEERPCMCLIGRVILGKIEEGFLEAAESIPA